MLCYLCFRPRGQAGVHRGTENESLAEIAVRKRLDRSKSAGSALSRRPRQREKRGDTRSPLPHDRVYGPRSRRVKKGCMTLHPLDTQTGSRRPSTVARTRRRATREDKKDKYFREPLLTTKFGQSLGHGEGLISIAWASSGRLTEGVVRVVCPGATRGLRAWNTLPEVGVAPDRRHTPCDGALDPVYRGSVWCVRALGWHPKDIEHHTY